MKVGLGDIAQCWGCVCSEAKLQGVAQEQLLQAPTGSSRTGFSIEGAAPAQSCWRGTVPGHGSLLRLNLHGSKESRGS